MLKSAFTCPKIEELAELIGVPLPHALGICAMLWNFVADHAPDGAIGKHSDASIARSVRWTGSVSRLVDSLVMVRLLDRDPKYRLLVHDWSDHCPKYVRANLGKRRMNFASPQVGSKVTLEATEDTNRSDSKTSLAEEVEVKVKAEGEAEAQAEANQAREESIDVARREALDFAQSNGTASLAFTLSSDAALCDLWTRIPFDWRKSRNTNFALMAGAVEVLVRDAGLTRDCSIETLAEAMQGYWSSVEGKSKYRVSLTRWFTERRWEESPEAWNRVGDDGAKKARRAFDAV